MYATTFSGTATYATTAGSVADKVKFPRNLSRSLNVSYYNNSAYSKYLMVRMQNHNNWRGYVACYISRSGYSAVNSSLQSYTGNADYESGGFWVIPPYSYYRIRSEYPLGGTHYPTHLIQQWVEWY